jgi:hypothetical protein
MANMVPLIIVIGLIISAAMLLPLLAFVGQKLQEEDAIGNCIIGLIALAITAAAIVGLGMALSIAAPMLTVTMGTITPLLIVIGLLVTSALLLIVLAKVGQEMADWGTIGYVLLGITCTTLVSAAIVGLGMALAIASPFLGISMGTIGLLFGVIGLLVASAALTLLLGKQGKTFKTEQTLDNANTAIDTIASVASKIAEFGSNILFSFAVPKILAATMALLPILAALGALVKSTEKIKSLVTVVNSIDTKDLDIKDETSNINVILNFLTKLPDKLINISSGIGFIKLLKMGRSLGVLELTNLIVNTLIEVTNNLTKIQYIELDTKAIEEKITFIFKFIEQLQTDIDKMLTSNLIDKNDNFFVKYIKNVISEYNQIKAPEKLNKVERIVNQLTNIANALTHIQDIKIEESTISTNVGSIFTFIEKLDTQITTKLSKTTSLGEGELGWVWTQGYFKLIRKENATITKLNNVIK